MVWERERRREGEWERGQIGLFETEAGVETKVVNIISPFLLPTSYFLFVPFHSASFSSSPISMILLPLPLLLREDLLSRLSQNRGSCGNADFLNRQTDKEAKRQPTVILDITTILRSAKVYLIGEAAKINQLQCISFQLFSFATFKPHQASLLELASRRKCERVAKELTWGFLVL